MDHIDAEKVAARVAPHDARDDDAGGRDAFRRGGAPTASGSALSKDGAQASDTRDAPAARGVPLTALVQPRAVVPRPRGPSPHLDNRDVLREKMGPGRPRAPEQRPPYSRGSTRVVCKGARDIRGPGPRPAAARPLCRPRKRRARARRRVHLTSPRSPPTYPPAPSSSRPAEHTGPPAPAAPPAVPPAGRRSAGVEARSGPPVPARRNALLVPISEDAAARDSETSAPARPGPWTGLLPSARVVEEKPRGRSCLGAVAGERLVPARRAAADLRAGCCGGTLWLLGLRAPGRRGVRCALGQGALFLELGPRPAWTGTDSRRERDARDAAAAASGADRRNAWVAARTAEGAHRALGRGRGSR